MNLTGFLTHSLCVYLEECSYESPPGLMSLSVCLSEIPKHVYFNIGIKLGCPCGDFCLSSVPSEYLFPCARRKFGFNKKICRNLIFVYVYYQPNSCTTHTKHEWAGGTFLRQWKKFLQPTCGCIPSSVILSVSGGE